MRVCSLDREDPLEKEMTIYSNILAWEIPWREEPDGLQSMGSQRVRPHSLTEQSAAMYKMDTNKELLYSTGN